MNMTEKQAARLQAHMAANFALTKLEAELAHLVVEFTLSMDDELISTNGAIPPAQQMDALRKLIDPLRFKIEGCRAEIAALVDDAQKPL